MERFFFSGSKDATCCLWRINCSHDLRDEMIDIFGAPELMQQHKQAELLALTKRFWGNACGICAVDLDSELGIAVSCGSAGNVVLHSLWDEAQSLVLLEDNICIVKVLIARLSVTVVVLCERKIILMNVVGDLIRTVGKEEKIHDALIGSSRGRELLVTSGELGCLVVRDLSSLDVLRFIPPPSTVRPGRLLGLGLTLDERLILAGSTDGMVVAVYTRDKAKKRGGVSMSEIILSVG